MDTSSKSLAEKLAETIISEINEVEDLMRLEAFRDLHDFCDANTLGESEAYFDKYGCEIVNEAQKIVDSQMPFLEGCRYTGLE